MKGIVEERAAMLGEYIIESKATVRSTAKKFGVSNSNRRHRAFGCREIRDKQKHRA